MIPGVTPWNPSVRATKRVTNPLPIPKECPNCGGSVKIVGNEAIYGRPCGLWPWALLCSGGESYVGLHPFTAIPLGTLADARTREARKRAKDIFNPLWQSGRMSRHQAYALLAGRLGIDVASCHIGWFDEQQCERAISVLSIREQQRSEGKDNER